MIRIRVAGIFVNLRCVQPSATFRVHIDSRPCLISESLKRLLVDDTLGLVGLGERDGFFEPVCLVFDMSVADLRQVECSMEQVGSPEGVDLACGEVETF